MSSPPEAKATRPQQRGRAVSGWLLVAPAALLTIGIGCQSLGSLTGGDAAPDDTFLVSPTSLVFGDAGVGLVTCGSPAPSAELLLTNTSSTSTPWWWALGRGDASPYTLSTTCTAAAPCGLAPGNQTITVTGPLVPLAAGIVSYDDAVTFFSAASPDGGTKVALTASSYGAVMSVSPTDLNFGTRPAVAPVGGYAKTLTFENTGNAEGILTFYSSSPAFQFLGNSPDHTTVSLGAGDHTIVTVVFNPEGSATAFNAFLAPLINGTPFANCGTAFSVTLEGQGSP
jgi:hypothetical protein